MKLSLTIAALIALIAQSAAQTGKGLVTVGTVSNPGVVTVGVPPFPATPQGAIEYAISNYLPSGGELVLLAGDYEFSRPAIVSPSGVTIRGSRGTVLRRTIDRDTGMFHVLGERTTIEGITFEALDYDVCANGPVVGAPLINVLAKRFVLRDCRLDVKAVMVETCTPVPPRAVVRIAGANDCVIDGSSFTFRNGHVDGLVGLSLEESDNFRIAANDFVGVDANGTEYPAGSATGGSVETVLWCAGSGYGTVLANSFRRLETSKSGVLSTDLGVGEGTHTVFVGNSFVDLLTGHAMDLESGHGFFDITGNVFSDCDAALRLTGGVKQNTVTANVFHGMGGTLPQNATVQLTGTTQLALSGNLFDQGTRRQVGGAAASVDLHMIANQFLNRALSPSDPIPPVHVASTVTVPHAAFLLGNAEHGWTSLFTAVDLNAVLHLDSGINQNHED